MTPPFSLPRIAAALLVTGAVLSCVLHPALRSDEALWAAAEHDFHRGDIEGAIAQLQRVADRDRDIYFGDWPPRMQQAQYLRAAERPDEAIAHYDAMMQGSRIPGVSARALLEKAYTHQSLGQYQAVYDEVRAPPEAILAEAQTLMRWRFALLEGLALIELKRISDALAACRKARREVEGQDRESRELRAEIELCLGRAQRATRQRSSAAAHFVAARNEGAPWAKLTAEQALFELEKLGTEERIDRLTELRGTVGALHEGGADFELAIVDLQLQLGRRDLARATLEAMERTLASERPRHWALKAARERLAALGTP